MTSGVHNLQPVKVNIDWWTPFFWGVPPKNTEFALIPWVDLASATHQSIAGVENRAEIVLAVITIFMQQIPAMIVMTVECIKIVV